VAVQKLFFSLTESKEEFRTYSLKEGKFKKKENNEKDFVDFGDYTSDDQLRNRG
jgi:hypothetical protein